MNRSTETLQSYLTFRLGDEIFAANVGKVKEILEIPRITKVPHSPPYMRGVINLRGLVLPVIDSRAKFGLPPTEDTINSCIIVLDIEMDNITLAIGIVVDTALEVMDIEGETIQEVPSIGAKYKSKFIQGMIKVNEQFIMLLDLDKVFSTDEASVLQDISNSSKMPREEKLTTKS